MCVLEIIFPQNFEVTVSFSWVFFVFFFFCWLVVWCGSGFWFCSPWNLLGRLFLSAGPQLGGEVPCAACSLLVLHCGDFVYPVRSSRSSLLYMLFGLFELISLIIFVPFFLCSLSGASANWLLDLLDWSSYSHVFPSNSLSDTFWGSSLISSPYGEF